MLRSYIAIALRNLRKNRLYTAINVLGLAVGLASFLLIMLFVGYERTYDRFHDNYRSIHRMNRLYNSNDINEDAATCSFQMDNGLNASKNLLTCKLKKQKMNIMSFPQILGIL